MNWWLARQDTRQQMPPVVYEQLDWGVLNWLLNLKRGIREYRFYTSEGRVFAQPGEIEEYPVRFWLETREESCG